MRIAVVGAGAIGSWFGVPLAVSGCEVSVLARGATLAALQGAPWRLDGLRGRLEARVTASDDPRELGVQDVVILALKGYALPSLAARLSAMIGPQTLIVPAMNGVPWWFTLAGAGELPPTRLETIDPGGAIAASLPIQSVIGCVVHGSASVRAPGHAVLHKGDRFIIGEITGPISARLERLGSTLERAGCTVEISTEIRRDIWYKLWGNLSMNPISALTGATMDLILDDALLESFMLSLMAEAAEIGRRVGCPISERGVDRMAVARKLGPFKTSMLQDAEAGQPLEVEQLLGAPREIAQRLSLATPSIDALLGLTRLFARCHGGVPG